MDRVAGVSAATGVGRRVPRLRVASGEYSGSRAYYHRAARPPESAAHKDETANRLLHVTPPRSYPRRSIERINAAYDVTALFSIGSRIKTPSA